MEAKRWVLLRLLCVLVMGFAPVMAHAISDCGIGFKSGLAPNIDGTDGGDWSDGAVSVVDKTTPCFEPLPDVVNGVLYERNVVVKTKRYSFGGQLYLGFLFDVTDGSATGSCGGGTGICAGEKVVVQFNRTIGNDSGLVIGQDKRFTLTYRRSTGAGGTTLTAEEVKATLVCPLNWSPVSGDSGILFAVKEKPATQGYVAEVGVPVSFLGGAPGGDFGIALAVINDYGKTNAADLQLACASGETCDGSAAAYPMTLDVSNMNNPIFAVCKGDWDAPSRWAVAYLEKPPMNVTISRSPSFWESDGILVHQCSKLGYEEGYTYYPGKPCKVKVRADLRNTGAETKRNVAFLWARHGTGDPEEYKSIGLKEAAIEAGTVTQVWSDEWGGMPVGEPNHPCLRVYAFPDVMTDSDKLMLVEGMSVSRDTLKELADKYSVEDQEWAQKNISRHSTQSMCPSEGCGLAEAQPLRIEWGLLSRAEAGEGARTMRPEMAAPTAGVASLARYGKNDVVVRIKTVGARARRDLKKLPYNFVEDLGGVIQVFPREMALKGDLPVVFDIANGSKDTFKVRVVSDVYVPEGLPKVRIRLPDEAKEILLPPRATLRVKGALVQRAHDKERHCWERIFDLRRCPRGKCVVEKCKDPTEHEKDEYRPPLRPEQDLRR